MADERVIHSEQIYDGKVVHLRVDTYERDGVTFDREIIQHGGAVAMIPFDEDGNVILVRQYRAAADQELLELPAGGLEPGEARLDCARRELQEEIGYYPNTLIELGGFFVAASYTTEYITIYIARDLSPSTLPPDVGEDIAVERVPFEDALSLAVTNKIEDSKTLIGLMWAAQQTPASGPPGGS